MGEDPGQAGQKLDAEAERTPAQVREEIEQTRTEMGDTVAALAAKTDVKRRAHEVIDEAKTTATGKAVEIKQTATSRGAQLQEIVAAHPAAAAGIAVLAAVILVGARRAS
jgi:hypothetical protein